MSIALVLKGTIDLIVIGQDIYRKAVAFMDAQEGFDTKGGDKKLNVMLLMRDVVLAAGKDWDSWFDHISRFIDSAKKLYNSVKAIV